MAVKQSPPSLEQKVDRTFQTKGEAEKYAKEKKKELKASGYSIRYDIAFLSSSQTWRVTLFYW